MKHKHYDLIVRAAGNTDAEVWVLTTEEEWVQSRDGLASMTLYPSYAHAVILPEEKEYWQALLDGKRVTCLGIDNEVYEVSCDDFMSWRINRPKAPAIPIGDFKIHDEPEQPDDIKRTLAAIRKLAGKSEYRERVIRDVEYVLNYLHREVAALKHMEAV